jgi:hypothetical protein
MLDEAESEEVQANSLAYAKLRIYKVREQSLDLVRPVIGDVTRMILTVRSPDVNIDE